ncbi:phage repressor protein/antirepressor Ant (plasmid) [Lichenicola cladoniae]|uniref:Phage repressor protein/antirepressor Ant n=2 Tax=Lichenicola cladoniae TaxID=1484109 RepID=A0A6M8HXZ1_9PROT|nr:phage repressor protein/antirepressor Ant [Acetobacteraceae bacterium]QKE93272.1 phage repressor protein/antirepressor Ant [Lichenicola cladoniae]
MSLAVVSTGQAEPAAGGLMPFSFGDRPVRAVTRGGAPWFVLADVCRVLEIANSRHAATRLDDDEKGVVSSDTPGGDQEMTIINESGLYSLVLTSRKPEAKVFKRWITSEVIPAIRRTGGYMVARPEETREQILARAVLVAQETINRSDAQIAEMAPKVEALERIAGAAGAMSVTDAGKILGMGQEAIFALMQRHGWLFKRAHGQTWLGYQDKVTSGHLDHRVTITTKEERETVRRQVLVTAKGLTALAALVQRKARAA